MEEICRSILRKRRGVKVVIGTRKTLSRITRATVTTAMVAGLWFSPTAVSGQGTSRNLTGIVTDHHHEPLKNAVVEIHNDDNDSVISYITDRSGRYSFKRLDGNTDYRVWATRNGRQSPTKKMSRFDAAPAKTINLMIRLP